jgi:hypothetical protein
VAGVIAALFAPVARLYEIKAAFGVVIVCVAFATTMEVMMATTVAKRMTPSRELFWIRIVIAFILCGFLLFGFACVWSQLDLGRSRQTVSQPRMLSGLKSWMTRSDAFLANQTSLCQASLF